MGTMHQLIVFFCGLVRHSSSASLVIFLSEFTLEEQHLSQPANIFLCWFTKGASPEYQLSVSFVALPFSFFVSSSLFLSFTQYINVGNYSSLLNLQKTAVNHGTILCFFVVLVICCATLKYPWEQNVHYAWLACPTMIFPNYFSGVQSVEFFCKREPTDSCVVNNNFPFYCNGQMEEITVSKPQQSAGWQMMVHSAAVGPLGSLGVIWIAVLIRNTA